MATNPPSVDIKDILVTASIGTFGAASGWSIGIGDEADSPDTRITILDRPGRDPSPKYLMDEPGIQIRVRTGAGDYVAGYAKALAIKDKILGLPSATHSTTLYVTVNMLGDIGYVGTDEKRRPVFSLNFLIRREPASGTNRT